MDSKKNQKSYELCDTEKIEKIKRSRTFVSPTPTDPKNIRRFFIFRWTGDEIEGILGQPITNYRRNTSYPLELENGSIREIFGNKIMHDTINNNELIGSMVRIVYIGYRPIPGLARCQKIYEIYKVKGFSEEKQPPGG